MESTLRRLAPDGLILFETMGWHPGEGIRFRDLHLDRMCDSARALDVAFPRAALSAELDALAFPEARRIRLSLALDGTHGIEVFPLPPAATRWRLALADVPLDERNPWRRHKTSERQIYDAARAALPEGVDEWLFLNSRGACAEGTITNLFVDAGTGTLLTPPLSAGVLPGVLRRHLIETGRARVASLPREALRDARGIYMGNALRGLIPCDLVAP
ncbi:hypothetical protein PSA7680_02158 [Pseudoruegeria aquimaris]|uniref:Probable branched-chain-amino-acid aminotransferase n=1 Tax=Pseudoruegeria aquimaris TaxID=393663 RepID=A0A1Y5SLU5_9RHOB|nr:aminotransferase class IV [Pseudoruegeria aquimaris]SLN43168.1 hypothetical protein PSA7680_02158 [Pseudoruegeria aquimaris]